LEPKLPTIKFHIRCILSLTNPRNIKTSLRSFRRVKKVSFTVILKQDYNNFRNIWPTKWVSRKQFICKNTIKITLHTSNSWEKSKFKSILYSISKLIQEIGFYKLTISHCQKKSSQILSMIIPIRR
jgi:hypothetical protein